MFCSATPKGPNIAVNHSLTQSAAAKPQLLLAAGARPKGAASIVMVIFCDSTAFAKAGTNYVRLSDERRHW